MNALLPSQRAWVDNVCLDLLDGQIVVLRGLPGTGKSVLANALRREFGQSAVMVDGRSFSEQNQHDLAANFREEISTSLHTNGHAQLIFDDYPHALRWTGGARLQALLLHMLVDGPNARDTGALLTGRWARSMHLKVRGSPLMARAQFSSLPFATGVDMNALGIPSNEHAKTRDEIGGTASLLGKIRLVGGMPDYSIARQILSHLSDGWINDLPWEAIIWLRNGRREIDNDFRSSLAWEAIQPLLADPGTREVLAGLRGQAFQRDLEQRSPAWPSTWVDSVERFADLISGISSLIWVDRYLTSDPRTLYKFVLALRALASTRLRLLISSTLTSEAIRRDVDAIRDLLSIEGVEIRSMGGRHYKLLHDRQLVFLGEHQGGVVLPTIDVILGATPVGSALAVQVPIMERALVEEAWQMGVSPDRFLPSQ